MTNLHTNNNKIFSTFIVKIVSRCNLNCSYCYMYNKGDLTYKTQPKVMSRETITMLARRVHEYAICTDQTTIEIILHGGEPMMAGRNFFSKFVYIFKNVIGNNISLKFNMQTNGTLIDVKWLNLLDELNIGFGISLDGEKHINDIYRVDRRGQSSFNEVMRAIELIQTRENWKRLFGGILSVVNLKQNPVDFLAFCKESGVQQVDFLLPDGHYDNPPEGIEYTTDNLPYFTWLSRAFDAWFDDNNSRFRIRIFEKIIDNILGNGTPIDYFGSGHGSLIVVETNGSIEPLDVFKICGNGFTKIGYSVSDDSFTSVQQSYPIKIFQADDLGLCKTCQDCEVRDICGGGYMPHRYSASRGFDNPSVYCRNLDALIRHIFYRVRATLPSSVIRKLETACAM